MTNADESPPLETQPRLAESPPDKLAPPLAEGFSVVLLELGANRDRVLQTVQKYRIGEVNRGIPRCPALLCCGKELHEAMFAQFELICTDTISVFLADAVVASSTPRQLEELLLDLRGSPEFEPVVIRLDKIPDDEAGRRFMQQFFGRNPSQPLHLSVTRKKARIMRHWAERIGGRVESEYALE
ncbi:MAG: hypothetical protein KDA44_00210 [Planctomycetales bacterium]|nr:hypothetical protein [Planctomycetales bacterium]